MKICMGADKKHSKFNRRNLFVELNEPHYMRSCHGNGLGFVQGNILTKFGLMGELL